MRYNLPTRVSEFAEIGRIFGVADASDPEETQARAAIDRVEAILETLGAPLDLRTPACSRRTSTSSPAGDARHPTDCQQPQELTVESVTPILERGYDGDRSWWQL